MLLGTSQKSCSKRISKVTRGTEDSLDGADPTDGISHILH